MNPYYLRLEGVNLSNFVYDTSDLSTNRGGSRLLSTACKEVARKFTGLMPVTTGASAGIFAFKAASDEKAEAVCNEVRKLLREGPRKHATFVVNWCTSSGEKAFGEDRERLLALNRYQQMRSPSLAIPSETADWACELDGVRPATDSITKGNDNYRASTSVASRREHGKQQKQDLYGELIGPDAEGMHCADDFDELTANPPRKHKDLAGKMAVLYLDGNDFGKIQDEVCTTPTAQKAFDKELQDKSKAVLKAILDLARSEESSDPGVWFHPKSRDLRLETLLLAGDELRFVVPAWCGWAVLDRIFRSVKGWEFNERKLTYKAGLVFCKHHAPIRRVLELAGALASMAKKRRRPDLENRNVFAYQVLESFDHIGGDLETFRKDRRRILPGTVLSDQILPGDQMKEIADAMAPVLDAFPRTKLHEIVKLKMLGREDQASEEKNRLLRNTREVTNDYEDVERLLGQAHWMHLLDLSDYLPPLRSKP